MSLSSLFIHPAATSTRVFCAIHLEQSLSKLKIIVNHPETLDLISSFILFTIIRKDKEKHYVHRQSCAHHL